MKVLLPDLYHLIASVTFQIKFNTYFDPGGARNRMKMFIAYKDKNNIVQAIRCSALVSSHMCL